VRHLKHPISAVQNFDRIGICIKLQRQWYLIYVRTCSGKLFQIRMNNRLSADMCLPQTVPVRKNCTHFSRNLSIPNSVVEKFNRNTIFIILQRLWFQICVRACFGKFFKLGWKTGCQPRFLSQTLSVCKTVVNLLFEISRFWIVLFKIVTEIESALNYKVCNMKHMFVSVPKTCLILGWIIGCQPWFLCLWCFMCVKPYLTFCSKSLDSE